jgi:hypothetical protein
MKKNDVGGACGMHGRARKPLRRLRHRRKDGIRLDVRETGWVGVYSTCECGDEPLSSTAT